MKTPREYIEEIEKRTDAYSKLTEEWAKLVIVQAYHFKENRDNFKSDTACQKDFDLTENGINMQIVKAKLKSNEKQISACKTALRLLENEAKNII